MNYKLILISGGFSSQQGTAIQMLPGVYDEAAKDLAIEKHNLQNRGRDYHSSTRLIYLPAGDAPEKIYYGEGL